NPSERGRGEGLHNHETPENAEGFRLFQDSYSPRRGNLASLRTRLGRFAPCWVPAGRCLPPSAAFASWYLRRANPPGKAARLAWKSFVGADPVNTPLLSRRTP